MPRIAAILSKGVKISAKINSIKLNFWIVSDQNSAFPATKTWERAIKLNPKENRAWANKGIALDYLSKYDEAIKAIDKSLEINLDFFQAWYNFVKPHKSIRLEIKDGCKKWKRERMQWQRG